MAKILAKRHNSYLLGADTHKPGPHDAMLHTCDGASKRRCDGSKSRAMCCDRKLNMLNILEPIKEYLSHLSCDLHAVCFIVMGIS